MRADWRVLAPVMALAALALVVLFLLRGTLVAAPQAVFPLILMIVVGGAMVWAWVRRHGDRG